MVNVLDVLETIKTSSSTLKKAVEASGTHIEAEASKVQAATEAGPSEREMCPWAISKYFGD